MKIILRTEHGDGLWWCLLLPVVFLINYAITPSGKTFTIFLLCSCLLFVVYENRNCIQSKCIFLPTLIQTSYLIMSFAFVAIAFLKGSTYSIYFLYITFYTSAWLLHYVLYSLLVSCPRSFTFGEAVIVAQGITLSVIACFLSWYPKVFQVNNGLENDISDFTKFLQILLLGCLSAIWFLYTVESLRTPFKFYAFCLILGAIMYFCWIISLHRDPFIWVFAICLKNRKRTLLMCFWVLFTTASILFVVVQNFFGKQKASTSVRKYFHIIINLVYLPGVIVDSELLYLASAVTFAIFVILETMRLLMIPPLGSLIQDAFQIFLDEKDSGVLILTHIYLLLGCSCPLWLYTGKFSDTSFQMLFASGILSVGVGDTMASVIGSRFGKHKWPGSEKSVEGTIAAVVTQTIVGIPLLFLSNSVSLINFIILFLGILITSLLEAKTTQVDNLVLPLAMYPFLCLIR